MSFLAGRLAGKEAAYFFQETKHAVKRLAEKSAAATGSATKKFPTSSASAEHDSHADVLPEVLRHSLPAKVFGPPPESSSLSTASKWVLPSDPDRVPSVSPDVLNPLRAYVSLPQVTFGPRRWDLPNQKHSVVASTANDLRKDKYTPLNPEKLKAVAEGLTQRNLNSLHKAGAFAVATAVVFGCATLGLGWAVSKLELHTSDDIRSKGKDIIEPKLEKMRELLLPFKRWAEETSKEWHVDREQDVKEKPVIIKELSKIFGAKS